jgi:glutamate/tyrosine decarboxylase-like PLP-dependent enzyme
MDRSGLPDGAFVDPEGGNTDAVRALAEDVFDLLLAQLETAGDRSPLPDEPAVPAGEIPETPRDWAALCEELDGMIEGSMNPAHPGYVGHMDTIPSAVSVLGDLVVSAVNNNMLSVEMSPVFSELEDRLTGTVAGEFGLGPEAGGVLTSGGSLANLQALAVARNSAFDVQAGGLADPDAGQGVGGRPVLFASEVAHTSLRKAAMVLGLGTDAVVPVETDADSRMRPAALRAAIGRAREEGQAPFCVVATAGTTTTGNVDPLPAVGEIAREEGLWLHVDAAYGGALVFSGSERDRLAGIGAADSVTFNPQKWCYVAKTCAMALFADTDVLHEQFRIGAPYMRDAGETPNLGELGVQGTRRADALKLWLTFQHLGRAGLGRLIDGSYRLTGLARQRIAAREDLVVASEPEMNIVCFRAVPAWCSAEGLDDLNGRLQRHLLDEHDLFLSLPAYRGSRWLRLVLLNPYTDERTVDRLFEAIDGFLAAEQP